MRTTRKRLSPVAASPICDRPKRAKRSRLFQQLAIASMTYARQQPNTLLHSAEVLVDILTFCDRAPTLDNIAVVSRTLSAVANRLPNLRRVESVVLEHGQKRGRYDVNADDKSSEECTPNEAFEALIAYANLSAIGNFDVKVGDKKSGSSAKFNRQLWQRLVNIVTKCDVLAIEGVDFSTLHADLLAKIIRSLRPSTVNFVGCLFGVSPSVDTMLLNFSQDTTIFAVRYRDGARHEVEGVSDEGIFRFLFERPRPVAEIKLSIECATVSKTFLRSLIERASTARHDFTLYVDRVHPDEQEGLEPYAEHVEDHRLITGRNAVHGCLPSGLNFLFYFEKGDFWSLRVGTTARSQLQAAV